jgi:hypothetical protein
MAIETPLSWFRGEDVALTVTLTPPTSISGWSLTFTVRDRPGGTVKLTKDNGGTGGLTITDAGNGVFKVTIARADTQTLTVQAYVYDIRRTDSGNNAIIAFGSINLKQEVTP